MGKDVSRDKEQALYWLSMSAEQGNEYAQFLLDHFDKFRDPSLFMATTRLLQQLGKIFEHQQRQMDTQAIQIDRKRMRVLREKKFAQGHAYDDREQKY